MDYTAVMAVLGETYFKLRSAEQTIHDLQEQLAALNPKEEDEE
jgi:hypothetical protein